MELKERVTAFINQMAENSMSEGFIRSPSVGFSSASDPLYESLKERVGPHHQLPVDVLPEAKTVISFFIPLSGAIVEDNRKNPIAKSYVEAYIFVNNLINKISSGLVDELNRLGFESEMIRATHTYDADTLLAGWSHRSAAFISGLGRFGRNRMLITSKGCAGRFGSVMTLADIPPDPRPETEFCLNYQGKACTYCISHCPAKALDDDKSFHKFDCNNYLSNTLNLYPDVKADACGICLTGPCAVFMAD